MDLHEARIYLAHLLYDRGDWEGALREYEGVPPCDHWDPLAVWRLIELKRALWHIDEDDSRLSPWRERLSQIENLSDSIDNLFAEIESVVHGVEKFGSYLDPSQLELFTSLHSPAEQVIRTVRLSDGNRLRGSWVEIVEQMRERAGFLHEPLVEFMRRLAERWLEQKGTKIPFADPEAFLRSAADAGFVQIELDE